MKIRTRLAERAEDSRIRPNWKRGDYPDVIAAARADVNRLEAALLALGPRTDANWREWSTAETRLVHAKRELQRVSA